LVAALPKKIAVFCRNGPNNKQKKAHKKRPKPVLSQWATTAAQLPHGARCADADCAGTTVGASDSSCSGGVGNDSRRRRRDDLEEAEAEVVTRRRSKAASAESIRGRAHDRDNSSKETPTKPKQK